LKPAADRLRDYLDRVTFHAPRIPVVNNVDVAVVNDPAAIKDALARQACSPVRWVEVVKRLAEGGVDHVVECGPGKVLSGMTKRIEPKLESYAINDRKSLDQALEALK